MDLFENVIPIIFLVFWVLVSLANKKKKRKEPPAVPQGGTAGTPAQPQQKRGQTSREQAPGFELLRNLRASFDTITQELELGPDLPKKAPGDKKADKKNLASDKKIVAADEKLAAARKRSEKRRLSRMKKEVELDDILSPSAGKPLPPVVRLSDPAKSSRAKIKRRYPVKKLREAVIWSEILAAPVSMRD